MLDEYWDEGDTSYPGGFDFCPDWLFQYYNEVPLGEAIERDYFIWKSEQHRLTRKCDILRSSVPFSKHYFVTMEYDFNRFKSTCQHFNFSTCSGRSE